MLQHPSNGMVQGEESGEGMTTSLTDSERAMQVKRVPEWIYAKGVITTMIGTWSFKEENDLHKVKGIAGASVI